MAAAAKGPTVSRGRDKHVIGLVIVADAVPLEVMLVQSVFGPPVPQLADIVGIERQSPYELILVGAQPRYELGQGVEVGPLAPLSVLTEVDTVIVPGIVDPLMQRDDDLLQALRDAHDAGARMVSLCGGAFILGQAGVLEGHRATTHWLLAAEFRERFPRVRLDIDKLYVDDPPVHTSGGLLAAADLAIHLVALDRGQAVANDVARVLVSPPRRDGGQAQFVKEELRADGRSSIDELLRWIREHLHEPLPLADIARHQHISERSLIRKFRSATGMSASDWIARERVSRAKVLLETTDFAIDEIAAMVGYGSRETLRRNFEKTVGTTAGAYRRTFGLTRGGIQGIAGRM